MIRSYRGYVEMIEMISRRLTKTQKDEILEAYRAGDNTNALAEKYCCTPNTINRTVKTLLSESEYESLKKRRSKIINNKGKLFDNQTKKEQKKNPDQSNALVPLEKKDKEADLNIKKNEDVYRPIVEKIGSLALEDAEDFSEYLSSENQDDKNVDAAKNNQNFDDNFEVIEPLISDFDFDQEKQKLDFEILNYENLPDSVYMIVDKKVELDLQPISDLPEWSFLPENELKRKAILLFANQRSAKRSCSRNQRVIKIPNTGVFKLSKPYLISKGITRLILEDSIIALDD